MIIGIVGSRRRANDEDLKILTNFVLDLDEKYGVNKIVTGDCPKGADNFAECISDIIQCKLDVKKKMLPKKCDYWAFTNACYKRNEEIAKEPLDLLIAVVAEDRKGGTENTIKHFKKHHPDWERKLVIL